MQLLDEATFGRTTFGRSNFWKNQLLARSKNKDNLASKKDYMIQKVKTNWPKKCRQPNPKKSDDLLLNKDKNKDELYFFRNQNIKTIKED